MKRKLEDKTAIRIVYKNRNALMYLKQTVQAFIESCFNGTVSLTFFPPYLPCTNSTA